MQLHWVWLLKYLDLFLQLYFVVCVPLFLYFLYYHFLSWLLEDFFEVFFFLFVVLFYKLRNDNYMHPPSLGVMKSKSFVLWVFLPNSPIKNVTLEVPGFLGFVKDIWFDLPSCSGSRFSACPSLSHTVHNSKT